MAAEIIHARRELETRELSRLRDLLWKLLNEGIPGLVRNGMKDGGLPHNLNVSVPGVDGAALYGRLKDVAVSNASACLNGVQDYSEVLTVLGVGKALARATLRFGLGRFNSEEEIRTAAKEVVAVVNELRRMEKEFAEQTGIPYDSWEKP
jgi:cysteine desulfurase